VLPALAPSADPASAVLPVLAAALLLDGSALLARDPVIAADSIPDGIT
jgi:hypothetical protein